MTHAASSLPRQALLMIIPLTVTALSLLSACESTTAPSAELSLDSAVIERGIAPAASEARVEKVAARDNINCANTAHHNLLEAPNDSIGSAMSNAFLSRRRADAVNAARVGMGIDSRCATAMGYGEVYPTADNATDTNHVLDRRVEV